MIKSYHYLEDGSIKYSNSKTIKTTVELDAGMYRIRYDYPDNCVILDSYKLMELIDPCFKEKELIDKYLTAFFDPSIITYMKKVNMNHKAGIMFHGKQGTGKSTIIRHYADRLIKNHNSIVFLIDPDVTNFIRCWHFIRSISETTDRNIVIILEEIDGLLTEGGISDVTLKNVLDGSLSINNCIFFASTNNLDVLTKALKDRPSRFKFSIEIFGLEIAEIVKVLQDMLSDMKLSKKELEGFAHSLSGSNVDEIKHFALDKVMGVEHYKSAKKTLAFGRKDKST